MSKETIRAAIADGFATVYREMTQSEPPELQEETVLLDTGLDSLGFTILVSNVEDGLGFDPFQISADAFYPVTFGEFVDFYVRHAPG